MSSKAIFLYTACYFSNLLLKHMLPFNSTFLYLSFQPLADYVKSVSIKVISFTFLNTPFFVIEIWKKYGYL